MNYLCTMFFSTNRLQELKKGSIVLLSRLYPEKEAENMVNRLILHYLGMSRVDQQLHKDKRLSESEILLFQKAMKRLLTAEPLQYVLGVTDFYGLTLTVGPGVLIPRPETEEMVDRILRKNLPDKIDVLDVGTGSGCIALALKNARKQWHITAVDVSPDAIELAKKNARKTGLAVDFKRCDVLDAEKCFQITGGSFGLIVSNPPYVLKKEKRLMADNVLLYEPETALFVEDDDPLLFYRKTISFSLKALLPGGFIFFEINALFARETARLFDEKTFYAPEIIMDMHGKPRIICARKR